MVTEAARQVSQCVADGTQQGAPVKDVCVGLHTDRRLAVHNPDDAATPRGHGDEDVDWVRGSAEGRADLGHGLTGFSTLSGNPSRKKITKVWPAAMADALRVARSTSSASLPDRLISRAPDASQNASPNRSEGLTPTRAS